MDQGLRKVSLRDYYAEHIDRIITETLDKNAKNSFRQLATAAQKELNSEDFPPGIVEDLSAYCKNFCTLVTLLSDHHLLELRQWTKDSAQTLVQVMIDKFEGEGEG